MSFRPRGKNFFRPRAFGYDDGQQFKEWIAKKPDFAVLPSYNERNKQAYQWAAELMHEAGLFIFGHTEDAPASSRAGQDGFEHIWGYAQALMTPEELHGFQTGKHLHWGTFLKDKTRVDQMIKESIGRRAYLKSNSGLRTRFPEHPGAQA